MGKDGFDASGHVEDVFISDSSSVDTPPNAPINWPAWKRNVQILMVAVHSMDSVFMAAGIIPGYQGMAQEYGISVQKATYLTSVMVRQFSHFFVLGLIPGCACSRSSSLESRRSSGFPSPRATGVTRSLPSRCSSLWHVTLERSTAKPSARKWPLAHWLRGSSRLHLASVAASWPNYLIRKSEPGN